MIAIQLTASICKSPIGDIQLAFCGQKLCYLDFADNPQRMSKLLKTRFKEYSMTQSNSYKTAHHALDQYFEGAPDSFESIQLDTNGTDFQEKIWGALKSIPYGQTMDYSRLAGLANNRKAVRAAASSNAKNPIAIIIPCHRVIGKDGSLRGYAGGVQRKRWLLRHEGAI